jgi:hypothetical protein
MAPPQHNNEEATPLFAHAIVIDDNARSRPSANSPSPSTTTTPSFDGGVHYGAATSYFFDFANNNDSSSSSSPSTTLRREAMMAIRQFSSRLSSLIEQHTGTCGCMYLFYFTELCDAANHDAYVCVCVWIFSLTPNFCFRFFIYVYSTKVPLAISDPFPLPSTR